MLRDYVNNLDDFCSIKNGSSLSGTTPVNGTAKAFGDHVGPVVGVASVGDAANSPSTQAHVVKLQESANGSNGWTDISGNDATATISANATSGVVQGVRSQPYVRMVITPAFTGGSSPTNVCSGVLLIQKAQVS